MGCWTPPFGNPQVLAGAADLAELLAACAAGASVPLGKAASACALASAAAPPPLRLGAAPPCPQGSPMGTFADHARLLGASPFCPLRSPEGGVCQSCAFEGFALWPPRFPNEESPPIMRECAWDNVRCGFCGNASANLRGSSCREAARSSVTPLARLWPQATLARPQRGNPKGGAALFGLSLPTFCRSRK